MGTPFFVANSMSSSSSPRICGRTTAHALRLRRRLSVPGGVAAQEDAGKCPAGKAPCWDVPIVVVAPGDQLSIVVNLEGSAQPHDFHLKLASGEVKVPADKPAIGGTYTLNATLPADVTTVDY